jgi:hypothetical protein
MRLLPVAGSLLLVLATGAEARLPPAGLPLASFEACDDPATNGGCGTDFADDATLAAELLYATMGAGAVSFALERAAQLDADADLDGAEFWRRIAMEAAQLTARRRATRDADR